MCHNEHTMYHKVIWPNCYHSHYKAQPNTHTKSYKVPNLKPQVGLRILGRLKNIAREVVEWTAWGIYETTTACCLGGQNNAFSDIVLGHSKPPTPWSPAFYPWLCLLHHSWQRNLRLTYMHFHIILSSGDLAVFVDGDKQAAQHLLNWDYQTKEKRQFTLQSFKILGAKAS